MCAQSNTLSSIRYWIPRAPTTIFGVLVVCVCWHIQVIWQLVTSCLTMAGVFPLILIQCFNDRTSTSCKVKFQPTSCSNLTVSLSFSFTSCGQFVTHYVIVTTHQQSCGKVMFSVVCIGSHCTAPPPPTPLDITPGTPLIDIWWRLLKHVRSVEADGMLPTGMLSCFSNKLELLAIKLTKGHLQYSWKHVRSNLHLTFFAMFVNWNFAGLEEYYLNFRHNVCLNIKFQLGGISLADPGEGPLGPLGTRTPSWPQVLRPQNCTFLGPT